MSDESSSRWGILTLAGLSSVCCIPLALIAGGATVTGGASAGVTAVGGAVRSIGGLLVVGLATAVPLFVVGVFRRRRARKDN
jgi:hypothetical protein